MSDDDAGGVEPRQSDVSGASRLEDHRQAQQCIAKAATVEASRVKCLKYDVDNHAGKIAASKQFEFITLTVIFCNAVWLGVDTDLNHGSSIYDTDIVFLVFDNLFCLYFTAEIIIRLLGYRRKMEIFRDSWFVFDSFLVSLMILETWIMPMALPKGTENPLEQLGFLKTFRLLRLGRLVRLLRSIPELLTIVKGIAAATSSVASVLLFLSVLVYVFGIVFTGQYAYDPDKKQTDTQAELEPFFGSLGMSMFTLICIGTFLDDVAGLVTLIREDSVAMLLVFFSFITLSSFTVLNMLIGILCDVAEKTGDSEQDKAKREAVNEVITFAFENIDVDGSNKISVDEFGKLQEDQEVCDVLERELGIDRQNLIECRDLIFNDVGGNVELSFDEFLQVLIRMRPEECASTMDIQQFRRIIRESGENLELSVSQLKSKVKTCKMLASGATAEEIEQKRLRESEKHLARFGSEAAVCAGRKAPGAMLVVQSVCVDERVSVWPCQDDAADAGVIKGPVPRGTPTHSELPGGDFLEIVHHASDEELMQELRYRLECNMP